MMKKITLFCFLFLFFSLQFIFPSISLAQGTFDCNWIVIAGQGSCRASNINCDSGYESNYALCGDLTPSGKDACNLTNQTCVPLGTGTKTSVSPLKGDCIDTAIGCIPLEGSGLVGFILGWAIGIGGGIAFLLMIYAGFLMMTSQGDPKRLQAGQELLTSAIMGLILLIFSVFILRLIGVDILGIPGLSSDSS